jgi:hypothetical protein
MTAENGLMIPRNCAERKELGGVCMSLRANLSCTFYPRSICLIEAQRKQRKDGLSRKTKRILDAAEEMAPPTALLLF